MKRFLAADWRALANVVTRREGRRALATPAFGFVGLAAGVTLVGARLLTSTPVRQALREQPALVGSALLALVVAVALVAGIVGALPDLARSLFSGPTVEIVLVAPVRRATIVTHACLVASGRAFALAMLLTLPTVVVLVARTGLGPGAVPAFAITIAALTLPTVALAASLLVLLQRFAIGPRARALVNFVAIVLGLGLTLLLMAGLVSGKREGAALARALTPLGDAGGPLLDAGRFVAAAGGLCELEVGALWVVAPLSLVPLALALVVALHASAYERSSTALTRRRSAAARPRRWPQGVVASVAWRDLLLVLRTRASIGAFAFFGAIAVLLQTSDVYRPEKLAAAAVSPVLNGALGLAVVWGIAQAMLAAICATAMLAPDPKELMLFSLAPVPRRRLLLGRLPGLALPWVVVLLMFMIAAPWTTGVKALAVLGFAAVALPWAATSLALVLAVVSASALGVGPALRLFLVTVAGGAPSVGGILLVERFVRLARAELRDGGADAVQRMVATWLGVTWGIALASVVLAAWIARVSLERQLAPQDR